MGMRVDGIGFFRQGERYLFLLRGGAFRRAPLVQRYRGDLYPTLAEFGGLSDTQPDILQGESLAGYIDDTKETANREFAYTVTRQGQSASLRTKRWRYTRWGEEAESVNEELYDHQNDPEEHVNLVGNERHLETLEMLRSKFEGIRQQARNGLPGKQVGHEH